jgi:glycine/D-amino acid oxidase-like deaminating enzyme/nitrite reductase/ring-hydroxylating ferredoxin subunit
VSPAKADRRQRPERIGVSPLWLDAAPLQRFPRLERDLRVEIVVAGAGITGLTTAYLLASAGHSVAVFDRARAAERDTGHTSAHLTMVTDRPLAGLVRSLGRERARAAWDAGLTAIERVEAIVRDEDLACDFTWVPGYLHAVDGDAGQNDGRRPFQAEADLAADLGFDASFVDDMPLFGGPGVMFERQARIHVRRYLAGLARAIVDRGGQIFEHSEVESASATPRSVRVNGKTASCDRLVIATHVPIVGIGSKSDAARLQSKLAPYTTYVVAGRLGKGEVPDALFWDTAQPYHYCRILPQLGHDVVIFGGEDHRTGQVSRTVDCFNRLEKTISGLVPGLAVTHRWSGQVLETPDGLPYIGETAANQFTATGFSGNGLTFGTLSAMRASDWVGGRRNEWGELFDPRRGVTGSSAWVYLKENADYPIYRVRDWLRDADKTVESVPAGEGRVLDYHGQNAAVVRADDGSITVRSAECTHMGCLVAWNDAEHTWDCPCHGSRFDASGAVIAGPAGAPLAKLDRSSE